ncbi:MAG: CDP-alcohol phosphatidyltransferase family protein [Clostridia bacterium]|nr:CDP-alcohol phosphatidyltransferase family protein [Clostridia bacterium]
MKNIPNILSFIRLLMIPVFVYTYFAFDTYPASFIAAGVYLLAWITDALDGYLARRNNWITDLGKWLDPLADKAMQFTAAICFAVDNLIFLLVVIPMFLKEMLMLIGGMVIIKRKNVVVQALWYGKVATIILFACAFFRIIIRNNRILDITVAMLILTTMIFALVMYCIRTMKTLADTNDSAESNRDGGK